MGRAAGASSTLIDRTRFSAQGLAGGLEGAPGELALSSGERAQPKTVLDVPADVRVRLSPPGGGGYGDPFERHSELVLDDVGRRVRVRRERAQGLRRRGGVRRPCRTASCVRVTGTGSTRTRRGRCAAAARRAPSFASDLVPGRHVARRAMLSSMAGGADVTSGPRSGTSFGGSRRAVVVGAGAIGLATAAELARRGWTVTVADAGSERLGASDISFARLNASEKTRRDYFELNAAGMAAFRSLAAAEGWAPSWLHLTGHLEWETTPDRRRRLRERTRLVESWGYAVTVLSGKDVRETLEPDLLAPDDEEVTFFPDEGYVETTGMLADLSATARAYGVEFRPGVLVSGLVSSAGRVRGVELATGEVLPADVVVSAAGRWTSELAEQAGAVVPLLGTSDARVAGFLARTAPTTTSFSRSVFSPGLNLRPDTDGRLVLQAFDLDDMAAADTAGTVPQRIARELARRLRRTLRLPGPVAVDEVQVGVRALPVDGFPVVGWAGTLDGFYVVVSHSGVTLCLLLGGSWRPRSPRDGTSPRLAPVPAPAIRPGSSRGGGRRRRPDRRGAQNSRCAGRPRRPPDRAVEGHPARARRLADGDHREDLATQPNPRARGRCALRRLRAEPGAVRRPRGAPPGRATVPALAHGSVQLAPDHVRRGDEPSSNG